MKYITTILLLLIGYSTYVAFKHEPKTILVDMPEEIELAQPGDTLYMDTLTNIVRFPNNVPKSKHEIKIILLQ